MLPSLSRQLKIALLSASSAPLKICCNRYHNLISYEHLHTDLKRPLPQAIIKHNHALLLHKTYNEQNPTSDWLHINFNQNFNARNNKVNFIDTSNFKQGKNLLSNRFTVVNYLIEYNWLNQPFEAFKILSKKLFLS